MLRMHPPPTSAMNVVKVINGRNLYYDIWDTNVEIVGLFLVASVEVLMILMMSYNFISGRHTAHRLLFLINVSTKMEIKYHRKCQKEKKSACYYVHHNKEHTIKFHRYCLKGKNISRETTISNWWNISYDMVWNIFM